ncbi:FAD-dependent oxidoreductase [Hydrogenophaga sp. XSHU_21]
MTPTDRSACVVGAGLAGAAVASALVKRGWRVTLLCAGQAPADGASALPVGVLGPHVTRAPTPMSRLTALGCDITRGELQRLVPPGHGWQPVLIDNLSHDAGRREVSLVRPSALVNAWIGEAIGTGRLNLLTGVRVASVHRADGQWQLKDARGEVAASAPMAVLASALGVQALGDGLGLPLPLRPVQGQISLGALHGEPLAERPQRDDGVFVPEYRDEGLPPRWPARIWTVGSTYRRGQEDTTVTHDAHRENLQRLRAMSPAAADFMETTMADGSLLGWAGVRCASLDRLPLIGAAPDPAAARTQRLADTARLDGLHLCCALGSRGLALAALAGQVLAAQMDGEPMPLEDDLRDAVDPARFAWRQARRRGG